MESSNFNTNEGERNTPVTLFERIANSSILKMLIIFILILIMMIPMSLLDNLVDERRDREQAVSTEIAIKWGMEQVITAPVLAVPFDSFLESTKKDNKGKDVVVTTIEEDWVFLLPDKNVIKTEIKPESLQRGIYNAVVYNADIQLSGSFSGYTLKDLPVPEESMKWSKAKLVFGIHDVKGLSSNPEMEFGANKYLLKMNNQNFRLFPNNMVADIPLIDLNSSKASFLIKLGIRGSKSINFLPLANQTNIEANGKWSNPSFNGGYLPEDRYVTEQRFEAKWGIPSFARKLPVQWISTNSYLYSFSSNYIVDKDYYDDLTSVVTAESVGYNELSGAVFERMTENDMVQINFLPEVNNYQKINRVAKYGILIIVLTFTSLFFIEIIKKQRVHIIQYILIGAAMVLFYSLLLAISEHLGFNLAYFVAAVATIILIASFIKMITKNSKTALLFIGILGLFYSFIFVLMQLRDYSLIVGTIGVFVILAVLMRVSTKVNWYQFDRK